MKKIDACYLCLNPVRNPVACSKGHIYCKECILASCKGIPTVVLPTLNVSLSNIAKGANQSTSGIPRGIRCRGTTRTGKGQGRSEGKGVAGF